MSGIAITTSPASDAGSSGDNARNTDDVLANAGQTFELSAEQMLEITRNNVIVVTGLVNQAAANTQKIDSLSSRMDDWEKSKVIVRPQAKELNDVVHHRVYSIIGMRKVRGRYTEEMIRTRKVYGDEYFRGLWGDLKDKFKVTSYTLIREIDLDDAIEFAKNWLPSDETELRCRAEDNWRANHPGQSLEEYLGKLVI